MIGDGRHISSEARTRPLFADRAAAQVCLTEYRKRVRQGRHISTRRGERGHLFAERASGAAISFFTFLIPCSAERVVGWAWFVARSEERPRAALFRPEGEKRPHIWPLERRGQLFHSKVHAYLSAKIGDGRHISSEARTRPLFADRATGRLRRSRSKCSSFHVPYNVCLMEYRKRREA